MASWLRRIRDRLFGAPESSPRGSVRAGDDAPQASPEPAPRKLVVGLGNPGPEYAATRHNVGFRVLECLASRADGRWHPDSDLESVLCRIEIAGQPIALLQPQTFMNRSGDAVAAALERWPALDVETDLLIVFDDLDLPTGRIRLRPAGGGGGHNGIGDILAQQGTKAISRLRFGVGHPGESGPVIDWVLSPFSEAEEREILPEAIEWAADAVEAVIGEGVERAMGRFNAARP